MRKIGNRVFFKSFLITNVLSIIISLINVSAVSAATLSSQIIVKDTFYAARWIYKIDHQDTVDCTWGNADPRKEINGVQCKMTVSVNWSWVSDASAGMRTNYPITPSGGPFTTPTFRVVDSFGNNKTLEDYSFWSESTGKRLYFSASPSQQNLTFVFAFNGPSKIFISYSKSALIDKDLEEVLIGSTSAITVNGPTRESVIAGIEARDKAAADRAAADRAAADKAAADKAAADKAAADKAAADAKAAQAAKKLTITCKKGKTLKLVRGETPTCPKGYVNPLSTYLTFQAFSKCALYKKDNPVAGVELQDGGKTLNFSSAGKYTYSLDTSSIADLACALSVMKAPSFVTAQLSSTRALDGLQKASWGKINAFWTYHPDNGVNMSFNTK